MYGCVGPRYFAYGSTPRRAPAANGTEFLWGRERRPEGKVGRATSFLTEFRVVFSLPGDGRSHVVLLPLVFIRILFLGRDRSRLRVEGSDIIRIGVDESKWNDANYATRRKSCRTEVDVTATSISNYTSVVEALISHFDVEMICFMHFNQCSSQSLSMHENCTTIFI